MHTIWKFYRFESSELSWWRKLIKYRLCSFVSVYLCQCAIVAAKRKGHELNRSIRVKYINSIDRRSSSVMLKIKPGIKKNAASLTLNRSMSLSFTFCFIVPSALYLTIERSCSMSILFRHDWKGFFVCVCCSFDACIFFVRIHFFRFHSVSSIASYHRRA